jgi:DNA-binding transcriptional regulator YhcF (GntR family)
LETGEEFTAPVVDKRVKNEQYTDNGWDKVWTAHIMTIVDEIGNQKMKVISWLIENRNPQNNLIIATQKEIAKGADVSRKTVSTTLTALKGADILTMKKSGGVYRLNPDFIFYGKPKPRQNIMYRYREEQAEMTGEDPYKKEQSEPEAEAAE